MPIKGLKGGIGSKALGYGLGGVAEEETDAEFNQTVLLLHGDGTNGQQNNTFVDSSTSNHTLTRNGDTTQGTFSPFSLEDGYWSNHFPGSSEVESASSTTFNITDYVTLECWVYFDSLGPDVIVGREANYWLAYNITGIGGTANKFVFSINNGSWTQAVSSSTTPVAGQWYHILGVKDGTTLRFYLDGTQENTSTFTGTPTNSGYDFSIGSYRGLESMNGYLSNVRLVTGASNAIFPYSGLTSGSSFSVPTTPLTAVSGTQILTCQSNRFVDNSTNGHSISIGAGTPKVLPFSPFAPTRSYSESAVGGSAYFDGTGDYLTIPDSADFTFGSNNFTIECWAYPTDNVSSEQSLISQWGTPNAFQLEIKSGQAKCDIENGGIKTLQGGTFLLDSWNHVAMSRTSSTFSLFLNGSRVGTTTVSGSVKDSNDGIGIGVRGGGTSYTFDGGYIADARIVNGSSIYDATQTSYTVPTAPLTSTGSETKLLLNFTNAGIIDHTMKNNLETEGDAQIDTSVKKFGTGSIEFDGTGDYLTGINQPYLTIGTGSYTFECWVYITTGVQQYHGLLSIVGGIQFQLSDERMRLSTTTGEIMIADVADAISLNTWTHLAFVRDASASNALKFFKDGTLIKSGTDSTNWNHTGALQVGRVFNSSAYDIEGYLDDVRLTLAPRYSSTFTAPTKAFANK